MAIPKIVPVCAYVAIPEGSSSTAPVMNPGPTFPNNNFSVFRGRMVLFPCYCLTGGDVDCSDMVMLSFKDKTVYRDNMST